MISTKEKAKLVGLFLMVTVTTYFVAQNQFVRAKANELSKLSMQQVSSTSR